MNQGQGEALAIMAQNLVVAYDTKIILDQVSFQVPVGTLAAIIGPNGGGKSTLLKSLLKLIPLVSGKIELFGQSPTAARHQVAYLPQTEEVDWLFPITCLDVVLQGRLVHLKWWQKPNKQDRELALESLATVGMENYAERPIGALSGGQKQRVFLARALAQSARMIIMDEPATGLDAAAQHQLLDLFFELQRSGHTIIITTHDLNCLAARFDQVLGLNNRLMLSGPPSEVLDAQIITELFGKHFPIIGPEGEVSLHDN